MRRPRTLLQVCLAAVSVLVPRKLPARTLFALVLAVSALAVRLPARGGEPRVPVPTDQPGSCAMMPAGLVSCWSGDGTTADSLGINNAAPEGNVGYAAGLFGQAFSFDGQSSVVAPDSASLDLTTDFTFSAWISPSVLMSDPQYGGIISKVGGSGGGNGYQLGLVGQNTIPGVLFNESGQAWPGYLLNTTLPAAIPLNSWTHIAGSYDHQTLRLYVNGALVAQQNIGPHNIVNTASRFRISGDDNNNVRFKGLIDEAAVFNRALSNAEVGSLAQMPLRITAPTSMSHAALNQPYARTVVAAGGVGPYNFSLASGALPTGLSLGGDGAISGTTSLPGTFTFTVKVEDQAGHVNEHAYSMVVLAPGVTPSISVTSDGRFGPASLYFFDNYGVNYYINTDNGVIYQQYSNYPWEARANQPESRVIAQPNGPDIRVLDFTSFDVNLGSSALTIVGSKPLVIATQGDVSIRGNIRVLNNGGVGGSRPEGNFDSGIGGGSTPGSLFANGGGGGWGAAFVFNSSYTPWGWDILSAAGGGSGGSAANGATGGAAHTLYGSPTSANPGPGGAGGQASTADVFQGGGGGGQGGYAHTWYCCYTGGTGANGGGALMFQSGGNVLIQPNSSIVADGVATPFYQGEVGGGGAGGGGYLFFDAAGSFENRGVLSSRGGAGTTYTTVMSGTPGAGGRVAIRHAASATNAGIIDVSAGNGSDVLGGEFIPSGVAVTGSGEIKGIGTNVLTGALTATGANVISSGAFGSVTFPAVTGNGVTNITPMDSAVARTGGPLPPNYTDTGLAFDVTTSANYTAPVTSCFFAPSIATEPLFSRLRVLHLESGAYVDRTILAPANPAPNFATHTICSSTSSLSPFILALINEAPNEHRWHADHTLDLFGARTTGDALLNAQYQFQYNWRIGIYNDGMGPLNDATITVAPAVAGVVPRTPPDSLSLPYSWTRQLGPSEAFQADLGGGINVPTLTELGYDVTRELVGGRAVAANATEVRTLNVTIVPHDPQLTHIGASVDFNGTFAESPGLIVASNVSCAGPGLYDAPSPHQIHWQVGDNLTVDVIAETTYTLTCSVTLTNTTSSPVSYIPAVLGEGQIRYPSITAGSPTTFNSTTAARGPADPLGVVTWSTSTPGTLVYFDQRFQRTVALDGDNKVIHTVLGTATNVTLTGNSNQTYGQQQSVFLSVISSGNGPAPTGSFNVTVDNGPVSTLLVNGFSNTPFNLGSMPIGDHVVTATYLGDANYATSTGSLTVTVVKASPQFQVVVPQPYPYGLTSSIMVTFQTTGIQIPPTGSISYQIDGGIVQSAAIGANPAAASLQVPVLTVGTHTVTWSYGGDQNYLPINTQTASVTVTKSTPTVFVNNPPSAPFGANYTFSATISSGFSGTSSPTGTISYSIDGGPAQVATVSPTSNTTQSAVTVNVSGLAVGSHTLDITYNGDSNFNASVAGQRTFAINKATPFASISGPNAVNFGSPVSVTVTVGAAAGVPTGTVSLKEGAVTLGTATLNGIGQATFSPSLNVGNHSLTATYNGDGNFFAVSTPTPLNITVNKAVTNLSLSGPGFATAGTTVTITATVTSPGGVPAGSVTLKEGATTLGVANLDGTGHATFSLNLGVGTHLLTAQYSGDANFQASSTGGPFNLNINKATPLVTLTTSGSPANQNTPVTLTVTVSGAAGSPTTGGVAFFDNGQQFAFINSVTNGVATFTSSLLTSGAHSITAQYNGNANYNPAVSAAVTQVITSVAPPFSQIYPRPDGACICTPTLMNFPSTGTQSWWFKATGALNLTVYAVSVNSVNAETVRARVFTQAGVQIGADVTASYPAGTPAETEASATGAFATTPDALYRVEIATPGTSQQQPHYRLKFDGAQEVGTSTPTSPSFEGVEADEPPMLWLMNANANEQIQVGFRTNSLFPAVSSQMATHAELQIVDLTNPGVPVPLVDTSNAPLGTTLTLNGGDGINSGVNATFRVAPSYVAAANTARVYALKIIQANGHYKLTRGSLDSDPGIYMSWFAGRHAPLQLTVSAGNVPFNQPSDLVHVTATHIQSGYVYEADLPAGTISAGLKAGSYHFTFTTSAGYTATPSALDVDALCDLPVTINVRVDDLTPPVVGSVASRTVVATSPAGAVVTFTLPAATDTLDPAPVVTTDHASGSTFPIGITTVTVTATDAGGNTSTSTFTVTVEPFVKANSVTSLVTSSTPSASGESVTFTATVTASGPVTGTVTFTDGSSVLGTSTVNASGVAVFSTSSLAVGPHTITAVYGGDENTNGGSAASLSQLVFGYLDGGGSFVIGNEHAVLGSQVTFWGAQWAKSNSLSGGSAPSSFKGFAANVAASSWTTDPGNSSNPPSSIAQYIAVIVTSSATQSGSTVSGNTVMMVVVKVDPGYAGNPGHAGTGTVVAVIYR